MHPELERLIRAYDAASEATRNEAAQRLALFDGLIDDALAQRPDLSRETLLKMVRLAYSRWVHLQEKPSTLPPKA